MFSWLELIALGGIIGTISSLAFDIKTLLGTLILIVFEKIQVYHALPLYGHLVQYILSGKARCLFSAGRVNTFQGVDNYQSYMSKGLYVTRVNNHFIFIHLFWSEDLLFNTSITRGYSRPDIMSKLVFEVYLPRWAASTLYTDFVRLIKERDNLVPCYRKERFTFTYQGSIPSLRRRNYYIDKNVWNAIAMAMRRFNDPKQIALSRKRDQPHKLNILITGESGTGKTRLAHLIASEFQMKMYQLDAISLYSKEKTNRALTSIGRDTIIVIDELDKLYVYDKSKDDNALGADAITDRTIQRGNLNIEKTMRSIGNFISGELATLLDGLYSSHGRVIIVIVNNDKVLPSYISRDRRIDLTITLRRFSREQMMDCLNNYFRNHRLRYKDLKRYHRAFTGATFISMMEQLSSSSTKKQIRKRVLSLFERNFILNKAKNEYPKAQYSYDQVKSD